jgi:hypothetical protein
MIRFLACFPVMIHDLLTKQCHFVHISTEVSLYHGRFHNLAEGWIGAKNFQTRTA